MFVTAYTHTVGEFVRAAEDAGLEVADLSSHVEAGASPDVAPRLLVIRLARP